MDNIIRRAYRMSQKRHGFTLLELILVIGLMSVLTLLSFYEKQTDLEQARARQVGGYLYQYNNAVRSALAQGLIPNTTTKLGTAWLKNSTCGGVLAVGSEYLPCDFPAATTIDPIKFGRLSLSTAVIVSGTAPAKKYQATTMTSPFTLVSSFGIAKVRADLAGVASLSAAAALTSGFQVGASSGLSPYTATTDSSYKTDPLSGVITIVASNTASNDVWLRTDGGNKMHATLNFDAANPVDRMILGASSIQNFAGQVLRIGNGSGLTPVTGAGVVIDSTTEVLGDFKVRRTLSVDNGISVTGDVNATGTVRAGGNLEANGHAIVQGSVVAQGDVTSNSSMSAAGNVTAGGALVSQIFYDSNNMGYYVDPHATSNVNTVNATGNLNAAGNVSAGGAVFGQLFYDSNNTGYYVDPHATSNLNSLYSNYIASNGRVRAGEFLELSGIATEGGGCAPNGLVGRDVKGSLLSCQWGVWQSSSAAAVLTGAITHGQQIPLPAGKTQAQCTFSVASGTNSHPGSRPDYAGGNYASVDGNRVVTCGFMDKGQVIIGGVCSYVVACN
jgi:prepilin-type N-terminal cleavage/methylation domain-containing protein